MHEYQTPTLTSTAAKQIGKDDGLSCARGQFNQRSSDAACKALIDCGECLKLIWTQTYNGRYTLHGCGLSRDPPIGFQTNDCAAGRAGHVAAGLLFRRERAVGRADGS